MLKMLGELLEKLWATGPVGILAAVLLFICAALGIFIFLFTKRQEKRMDQHVADSRKEMAEARNEFSNSLQTITKNTVEQCAQHNAGLQLLFESQRDVKDSLKSTSDNQQSTALVLAKIHSTLQNVAQDAREIKAKQ